MKGTFESFAVENKGIFRIGSVNCVDHAGICEKEGVKTHPTLRVYPEFPNPHFDFDMSSDDFNIKKLKTQAGRYYEDKSIVIT